MELTLGQITDSEHDLLGAVSEEEFIGALDRAPMAQKRKFFNRAKQNSRVATSSPSSRSRGEFERRIALLPPEIRQGLANQTLQAVDAAFYVVKGVGKSKVSKMFRDDDNKVVGQANISSAKLEKGNFMLLWGIQVLAGTGSGNPLNANETQFEIIPSWLRNGEFELKANGTVLVPNTSLTLFDTTAKNFDRGLYVLDNPKIIKDQQAVEMNLEWAVPAPDDAFIKVILRGTAVIKA